MLFRSHLLPARPGAWPAGRVRGLRARGGFEVDLDWAQGLLSRAVVRSRLGGVCRVRTHTNVRVVGTQARRASGPHPNPFYPLHRPAAPVMVDATKVQAIALPETVATDFATDRGREYLLTV